MTKVIINFFKRKEWEYKTSAGKISKTISNIALKRIKLPINTKIKPKTNDFLFRGKFDWLAVKTKQNPESDAKAEIVV